MTTPSTPGSLAGHVHEWVPDPFRRANLFATKACKTCGVELEAYVATLEARLEAAERALTFEAFQAMNKARCESDDRGFGHKVAWDNEYWPLQNWALAITGEAGELANIVKKCLRGDFTVEEQRDAILEELADVMTYCDLAISSLGAATGDVLLSKFDKVSRRIGYTRPATAAEQEAMAELNEAYEAVRSR